MQIRGIKLVHFRGIDELKWFPGPGVNALVGPGDVGKTTVLDAIAMALSPAPGWVASEHDYYQGDTSKPFGIDLLVGKLNDEILRSWPVAPVWSWNSTTRTLQAAPDPKLEPVLRIGVRGSEQLEISHFALDPSGGELPLSPSTRRKLGLSTLGSPATAYRELRMSRGSLLSRSLSDEQLRRLVTDAMQTARATFAPSTDIQARLLELSDELERIAPGAGTLALAMLPARGQNLLGMVGLFADRGGFDVPLANAGLGTQQLVLFTLASKLTGDLSPVFVVDEIESGLEPFRQRDLIARVTDAIRDDGQAFLTTHSPAVVGEIPVTSIHRLTRGADSKPSVAALPQRLDRVRRSNPEALLCRLPVIAEGDTEVGLLEALLEHFASGLGTTLGAIGIRCVDGGGQPKVFETTAGFRDAHQRIGAFLDTDTSQTGKRKELNDDVNVAFKTYSAGTCFEEAVAAELPIVSLDSLIAIHDNEHAVASRYQQLNAKTGQDGRRTLVEIEADLGDAKAREIFVAAALSAGWFKHRPEARAAGEFIAERHPNCQIAEDVRALWSEILALIGHELPAYGPDDGDTKP